MLRGTVVRCTATLAVLASWAWSGACSSRGTALIDQTPNLVFISIDTLRADHVGCYGHATVETPQIDRLAAEGTRFETCISSCPLTLPSHSTMMTGTYPFVHGARNNGTFVLAQENVTLAEVLREAGYATHAEVGAAVLEAEFGLDQGFDGYGDTLVDDPPALEAAGDGALRELEPQRAADAVTDAALDFLESRRNQPQPFFLFLHYFDPHQPYQAPAPYSTREADGYLAEIAYTDAQVGRVLDVLRGRRFADSTVVVLTSDHGDGLSQHSEPTHGAFLYDSTLRVPLVIWAPNRVAPGQVVASQVGLVDLLPTILELLHIPSPTRIQGTSLVPLLDDPSRDLHLHTYAETLEPRLTFGYSELRALRQDGWKYIHGPRPELYQVEADPDENQDRALEHSERLDGMRASLRQVLATSPPLLGRGEGHELDAEDLQRLAALGYASAGSTPAEDDPHQWSDELVHFDEPRGASPMDRVGDIHTMYTGLGALRDGDHELGIENWTAFLESNPEYAPGYSYLAQCLASSGRGQDAIAPLRRALELDPSRCGDHQMLGSMLAQNEQRVEARQQFERALECDPNQFLAAINLSKLLVRIEDHEAALTALDTAIELAPESIEAHSLRARALRGLNRDDEAVAGLRTLLARQPRDAGTRLELASLLAQTGRVEEAATLHGESLSLLPGNPSVRGAAARFWIDRSEGARALAILDAGPRKVSASVSLAALRVRLLATDPDPSVRDGMRAQALARELLQAGLDEDPRVLAAAANAAAEVGNFEQAIELGSRAIERARERDAGTLAQRVEAEVAGYRDGRAARAR